MDLKIEEKEGIYFIVPEGKVTAGSGGERFRADLDRLIKEDRKRVVADLSNVPYIDSSVLDHLIHGYVTLKEKGGMLKLLKPSKQIVNLLSLTRLIKFFEVYENRKEVLHSWRAKGTG